MLEIWDESGGPWDEQGGGRYRFVSFFSLPANLAYVFFISYAGLDAASMVDESTQPAWLRLAMA